MSSVRTKADGVKQLRLTPVGRVSLFNFSPEEWEELKRFMGVDLLFRLNNRVNGDYGTPPARFPEYEELRKIVKKWSAEPETVA